MSEKSLYEKLKEYAVSSDYPFHMPGHKRTDLGIGEPSRIDITEIPGFDDLHCAKGIILESEKRAAALWGVKRSFFLVNGSTVGILSAISAAAEKGSRILVAENCHKSVRHACFLRDLEVSCLKTVKTRFGVPGQISPEELLRGFHEFPDAKTVVITSPTYEGILSDIRELSDITHRHGAILIVDEAHGAHLAFSKELPEPATALGADLVVESIHKTLPSLTQTALLHIVTDRIPEDKIAQYLDIYETSSPSYVLLSSIDRCISILASEREAMFSSYIERLNEFYRSCRDLKSFSVLTEDALNKEEAFEKDPGKIIIRPDIVGVTGNRLSECLREVYHLVAERAEEDYVIAMTSISDTKEGFLRLKVALHELDRGQGGLMDRESSSASAPSEYEIYRGFSKETPI